MRSQGRPSWPVVIMAAVAAGLSACGNPTSTDRGVVGSYVAMEWTIVSSTTTHDLIAGGGHLDLALASDGTTTGEFFIPAGVSPEPREQRVSMAGTWSQDGDIVTFSMPGDTYVRFVDWTVSGRQLTSQFVNGGFTLTTRLRR